MLEHFLSPLSTASEYSAGVQRNLKDLKKRTVGEFKDTFAEVSGEEFTEGKTARLGIMLHHPLWYFLL